MATSLSSILIHLVFSTKHRALLIKPEIEPELFAYIGSVFRTHNSPMLAIGGTENHLHILFSLSRTITLAKIVEEVKRSSSTWLKTKGEGYCNFYWQTGYGAFSIGQSNVETVKNYIARQKEHHRQKNFEDELRVLLQKYQIEFDEKYLWD